MNEIDETRKRKDSRLSHGLGILTGVVFLVNAVPGRSLPPASGEGDDSSEAGVPAP